MKRTKAGIDAAECKELLNDFCSVVIKEVEVPESN